MGERGKESEGVETAKREAQGQSDGMERRALSLRPMTIGASELSERWRRVGDDHGRETVKKGEEASGLQ
jgi:hypothetical protein